jgi:hypothetical protein
LVRESRDANEFKKLYEILSFFLNLLLILKHPVKLSEVVKTDLLKELFPTTPLKDNL